MTEAKRTDAQSAAPQVVDDCDLIGVHGDAGISPAPAAGRYDEFV
jgi:hypothetical protein